MVFFSTEKWSIKYGSYCIVATAQMKFASEARPSQYIGPFGNTEPTCMPLSGHFMDIEGRVLVYQTERYQLSRGCRVVRWCWVNFQCRGVLLVWITVGQGRTALAVGTGGGCLEIFTLIYPFSPLSPSLWETARYRLKYCLKGPLNPKQPTNQLSPTHNASW